MRTLWVVVADQARARFFACESLSSDWRELEDLVAPEARRRDGELGSDRSGHVMGRGGQGHTLSKEHSLREEDADRFAERIAARLTSAADANDYGGLVLIAPPRFLGLLRDALPHRISLLVRQSLDRDLVSERSDRIRDHLPEFPQ